MASLAEIPTYPASIYTIILLLLLVVTASNQYPLVNADEALIQSICKKTEAPNFCVLCLRSDPQASTKDVKGFAATAINCGLTNTVNGGHQLVAYKDSNVTDPGLKADIDTCIDQFLKVVDDLTAALDSCHGGDYKGAADQAAAAVTDFDQCSLASKNSYTLPDDISTMFFSVNSLVKDAKQVTQQAL